MMKEHVVNYYSNALTTFHVFLHAIIDIER